MAIQIEKRCECEHLEVEHSDGGCRAVKPPEIGFGPNGPTRTESFVCPCDKFKEQRRPRCPFYGFHLMMQGTVLMDLGAGSNGCALEAGYKPCVMGMQGRMPELATCDFAETIAIRASHLTVVSVHPKEFSEPVSLATWAAHVCP